MKLTNLNQLIVPGSSPPIDGTWKVTPQDEIHFAEKGSEKKIVWKGYLVSTEAHHLIIALTHAQNNGKLSHQILRLNGRWQVSPKNQIQFVVEKRNGSSDVLTLKGVWSLSKRQEITYRLKQTRLKTKTKKEHFLTFRGYWDIFEKDRLTYVLSADGSSFRFRGAFQTRSILAKRNEIRYQLGVQVGGTRRTRTLSLFGKWKLARDLALRFEVDYGQGRRRAIAFGADVHLKGGHLLFKLKIRQEKIGLEVVVTREFLRKQGESFLRFRKDLEGFLAEAGLTFRW